MLVCRISVCLIWTVCVKVYYGVGILMILLAGLDGNGTAYAWDGTSVWVCSVLHDFVTRATPLWSSWSYWHSPDDTCSSTSPSTQTSLSTFTTFKKLTTTPTTTLPVNINSQRDNIPLSFCYCYWKRMTLIFKTGWPKRVSVRLFITTCSQMMEFGGWIIRVRRISYYYCYCWDCS